MGTVVFYDLSDACGRRRNRTRMSAKETRQYRALSAAHAFGVAMILRMS